MGEEKHLIIGLECEDRGRRSGRNRRERRKNEEVKGQAD